MSWRQTLPFTAEGEYRGSWHFRQMIRHLMTDDAIESSRSRDRNRYPTRPGRLFEGSILTVCFRSMGNVKQFCLDTSPKSSQVANEGISAIWRINIPTVRSLGRTRQTVTLRIFLSLSTASANAHRRSYVPSSSVRSFPLT